MGGFPGELRRAQDGDRDAAQRLLEGLLPRMRLRARRRLRGLLRRHYDSLDIVQSAILEALRVLPDLGALAEGEFLHLLEVITDRKVRKKYRKHLWPWGGWRQVEIPQSDLPADDGDPAGRAEDAEERQLLRNALSSLGEEDRRVLVLRGRDGLSHAAVAERMVLPSADAARKRYARALILLRKHWKDS